MVSRRTVLAGAGAGVAALGVGASLVGPGGTGGERTATVLVAGSLQGVATQVPGASVEAHGSAAVRRLVREGLREPDAVAVADPRLLVGIVEEATLFATNALVLAYNPDSPRAEAVAADWATAIEDESLRLGRTDPQTDPLGYRTVMGLRLAAEYGVDARRVLAHSSVHPETALMNLLERGDLEAAFAYRNMALERDLPAVDLPARVDFSSPALADHYGSVAVTVQDQRLRGAPIRYAAAALSARGEVWVRRLVTGHRRLREGGFVVPDGYPRRTRV